MPRIPTKLYEQRQAAEAMKTFAPKPKPKRSRLTPQCIEQTREMMSSDDWSKAKATHLVALYMILYEQVYEVEILLKSEELRLSKLAAGRLIKAKCKGSIPDAVKYMKWVWKDARGLEGWRRQKHIDGKPLGWRACFDYKWNDYLVAMQRRTHA